MIDFSIYDKKALPIGVDNFEKVVSSSTPSYYYVDKSMLIYEILQDGAAVHLIPRPRRFGKSLNLDMLHQFLALDTRRDLFRGLQISRHEDFCRRHQGQYPVLHLDWKDVCGEDYDEACYMLAYELQDAAAHMAFLRESRNLDTAALAQYDAVLHLDEMPQEKEDEEARFQAALQAAPLVLTQLLEKHYHRKVVVLIDEYDTPLSDAYPSGYYSEMVSLMRGIYSKLLKDNDSLAFAILTGCLPLPEASLFTGLNNLKVWTGKSDFTGAYFGFTEDEIKAMLAYYQLPELLDIMRDWFDGFQFGGGRVYCPWDVISFVDQGRRSGPGAPAMYWVNTSGNDIVQRLLSRADRGAQRDYIALMAGKSVWKTISRELTIRDLDSKGLDGIWSMMVAAGYLSVRSEEDDGLSELSATNREIRWLLSRSLQEWLCNKCGAKSDDMTAFSLALKRGDPNAAETALHAILSDLFPAHTASRGGKHRVDFDQRLLLGLLLPNWMARAEVQSGEDCVDVCFRVSDGRGIVIAVRDAGEKRDLNPVCDEALEQIQENRYAEALQAQGCGSVLCYGIAFQKAKCNVKLQRRGR